MASFTLTAEAREKISALDELIESASHDLMEALESVAGTDAANLVHDQIRAFSKH